jgi:hypothetical protein
MADLSPATQAIIDAFTEDNSLHDWKHNHWNTEALAAALRAAADQVVPEPNDTDKALLSLAAIRNHCKVRDRFFAIAAELDNTSQLS